MEITKATTGIARQIIDEKRKYATNTGSSEFERRLPQVLVIGIRNGCSGRVECPETLTFTDDFGTQIYKLVSTVCDWRDDGFHVYAEVLTKSGWVEINDLDKQSPTNIKHYDTTPCVENPTCFRRVVLYERVQKSN